MENWYDKFADERLKCRSFANWETRCTSHQWSVLNCAHCTVHAICSGQFLTVHCAISLHCALCNVQSDRCTLWAVKYTLCSVHYALCRIHRAVLMHWRKALNGFHAYLILLPHASPWYLHTLDHSTITSDYICISPTSHHAFWYYINFSKAAKTYENMPEP